MNAEDRKSLKANVAAQSLIKAIEAYGNRLHNYMIEALRADGVYALQENAVIVRIFNRDGKVLFCISFSNDADRDFAVKAVRGAVEAIKVWAK